MDLRTGIRPGRAVQRVNVDIPVDLLRESDQEARRLGVTRQAFIKIRLADALMKVRPDSSGFAPPAGVAGSVPVCG